VETHPTLKVQALEDMKVRQRHLIMDVMLIAQLPPLLRIRMFLCLPDPFVEIRIRIQLRSGFGTFYHQAKIVKKP
jgi:hypothetical protein